MFREMRRSAQQLSDEETVAILKKATSGVLALAEGDEGYPYAVPLSHYYQDGKLYFHCAVEGHKLDAVRRNEKASFCVISEDEVVPETFSTRYRSVIAFGHVRIMEDGPEKYAALRALGLHFAPGDDAGCEAEIKDAAGRVCMLEMTIDHLTGKEARSLMQERRAKQ